MSIQENINQLHEQVARAAAQAERSANDVTIVGVTKYVDAATTRQVFEAGLHHLGENRVEAFLEKKAALADLPISWHFIGSLQRRKVKDVINEIDYFHGLDSIKLAKEIDKRALKPIKCFLQVNISEEASKHGFKLSEIDAVIEELQTLSNIRVIGVMTMAPFDADAARISEIFSQAHELQEEIAQRHILNMPSTELSMGMSQDYAIAIQNGATFIRVGSQLYK
jgi:pyridoxal phosphate enzyme (YggS family)